MTYRHPRIAYLERKKSSLQVNKADYKTLFMSVGQILHKLFIDQTATYDYYMMVISYAENIVFLYIS